MTDGLVVVDKPGGCTSHDVVARVRRIFAQRRVGHAGTLDPDATGVLLVGLGRATRLLQFLSGLPKTYTCQVVLGVATTTLDAGGEVTGRWDMSHIGAQEVLAAAEKLTGTIEQVPPMVSAVKVGGRRLHQLAREGVEVERPARTVSVHRLELRPASGDAGPGTSVYDMVVECSSGTYIRSLAADLGRLLGGGAHLRKLRRLSVGDFTQEEAVALDDVGPAAVISPAAAMRGMATAPVGPALAAGVANGKVFERGVLGVAGEGPWAILGQEGELLAVYRPHGSGHAKPVVVLAAPGGGGQAPPATLASPPAKGR